MRWATGGTRRGDSSENSQLVVSRSAHHGRPAVMDIRLLGRFALTEGGRSIRSWSRPSARRLCQLVLVSPGRWISRDSACEALFPSLSPKAAARSLYKVQSMARLWRGLDGAPGDSRPTDWDCP